MDFKLHTNYSLTAPNHKNNLNFRVAVESDRRALLDIFVRNHDLCRFSPAEDPHSFIHLLETQFDVRAKQNAQRHPAMETIVAVVENQIVGYFSFEAGKTDIFVVDMAVHPDFQRNGYAMDFLKRLQVHAKARRLPLTLQVSCHNSGAIKLYDKAGFTQQGLTADSQYLRMKWDFQSA